MNGTKPKFLDGIDLPADYAGFGNPREPGRNRISAGSGFAFAKTAETGFSGGTGRRFHLLYLLQRFLRVRKHHQGVSETVLLFIQGLLVMRAKALVIYLNADIGLHNRCTVEKCHALFFYLPPQKTKRAVTGGLYCIPDRNRVNMISHVTL